MGCLGGVGANGLTREAISRSLEIREYCRLHDGGRSLLRSAVQQLQRSARAFHRILKLARTIGDLVGEREITTAHLAEAIQYRPQRQM